MRKYKYCRCCRVENKIENNNCCACGVELDNKIYVRKRLLYFVLSLFVIGLIILLEKIVNGKLSDNFVEIQDYIMYTLVFLFSYFFFAIFDSPKINNYLSASIINRIYGIYTFFTNPIVYDLMDSTKNIRERIIMAYFNSKVFFTLRYIGILSLLISIKLQIKYISGYGMFPNYLTLVSVLLLILLPLILPQIVGLKKFIDFAKKKR